MGTVKLWNYSQCGITNYHNLPQFVLEWYDVSQDGKNPILVQESFSCGNRDHYTILAFNDNLGDLVEKIR